MIIGIISYATAAGIFIALTVALLSGRAGGSFSRWLAVASGMSTLWAVSAAYQAAFNSPFIVVQLLEFLRDLAWLTFMLHMLTVRFSAKDGASTWFTVMRHGVYAFTAVMMALALYLHFTGPGLSFLARIDFQFAGNLLLAVIGLVLLEQIMRNTPQDLLRAIKYLCFGMGGMFAYDFYLYSDALLFQRIDPALWEARGFINATIVPVIGIGLSRNPQWTRGLFISRRIVFHTSALLGSAIYLLAMGVGGYYVRDYGGTWGVVAQTIFLFGVSLILLILLFSGPLRARLRVFINKHFFHYKYDYREEWLSFIKTLSSSDQNVPLPDRVIRAMAQMIDCPGGVLWVRHDGGDDGMFNPEALWNITLPVATGEPANSSLIQFLETHKWVINLDEYGRDPELYKSLGDLDMPSWLKFIPDAWLISPLILREKLLGFVVLTRSLVGHKHFNWEDSDLLKTSGSQAAGYLAQHAISQALAEARQFEAFNRLSTYVVHDLKNLISQLSLVVSNAARHKKNPLFMENVISTVENSVSKMDRLLLRLRDGVQTESKLSVDLAQLLEEVVRESQAAKPSPVFECQAVNISVTADRDQLASVVGHVIRNAQDATPEDGKVIVKLEKINGHAVIEIQDNGCGMDESFISDRLFRPFQTTKGSSGMGIGVYEAREFVRSLGGNVYVESKPGRGTVFRIHLPYQATAELLRYRKNLH